MNSPLKTLLNKPFSIGSPSYSSYGSGKVRLTFRRHNQNIIKYEKCEL